uniref:Putative secreted peptide n=1 Tax=Anopheles braziliensis TaxID=58242 RepID=A0A2M3ZRE1_9DIPT
MRLGQHFPQLFAIFVRLRTWATAIALVPFRGGHITHATVVRHVTALRWTSDQLPVNVAITVHRRRRRRRTTDTTTDNELSLWANYTISDTIVQ